MISSKSVHVCARRAVQRHHAGTARRCRPAARCSPRGLPRGADASPFSDVDVTVPPSGRLQMKRGWGADVHLVLADRPEQPTPPDHRREDRGTRHPQHDPEAPSTTAPPTPPTGYRHALDGWAARLCFAAPRARTPVIAPFSKQPTAMLMKTGSRRAYAPTHSWPRRSSPSPRGTRTNMSAPQAQAASACTEPEDDAEPEEEVRRAP